MALSTERIEDVIVVILGGGRGTRLDPLTRLRSKPAVPIAGNFRLIDIPISNAINSGMERMFVLTQFNSVSLHRHITRTYKFDPFSRGFVQILAAQQTPSTDHWFQGTADAVRQNRRNIADLPGDLVLILSGDHLYRMDYRKLLEDHLQNQADISLAVLPCSEAEIAEFGAVRVNPRGRVVEFREKPQDPETRAGMEAAPELLRQRGVGLGKPFLASMGIYLFDKQVLLEMLDSDFNDFGKHILPAAVERQRVQAHFFDGYWRDIGTIRSFFEAHMDLVDPKPPFDLYDSTWPFYTHPRFLPGTKVTGSRFDRSMLSEGSVIENSVIENSIIGIRSRIRRAQIHRTLIMGADLNVPNGVPGAPPVGIGEGTVIEDAIIDKNARIGRNVRITNPHGLEEADGPGWAIRGGIVVIPKNAVIPDGTEV